MKRINFKEIAIDVIETEIKSLKKLKLNINKSFDKVVEAILSCKNGKVIISGAGKSGIIGKKISSTFASVGIPSFFVDASACSHGDLGQISSNDVLILISFSGETVELKNIIQYANRNKRIVLIGIVSKKNSLLYKSSDIKLLVPNVVEAGPGNIVPTSSTIVQLAIGDALAIATMKYKKFGKLENFTLKFSMLRNYYYKNILSFGDLIHRIHPLAGQGFNMTIRDIKILSQIIEEKINLGLEIDNSVGVNFEKKTKHLNFIYGSGVDLIYKFFNLDDKLYNSLSEPIFKIFRRNNFLNKYATYFSDKGMNI